MQTRMPPLHLGDIFGRLFKLIGKTAVRNLIISLIIILPAALILSYGMDRFFSSISLASGSLDNSICLWDVATGKEKARLVGHTSGVFIVACSGDGSTLASGSWDESIRLWDVGTGKEKARLEGHTSYVSSVACSGDGLTLASGSYYDFINNSIHLWDVATGKEKAELEGHPDDVTLRRKSLISRIRISGMKS